MVHRTLLSALILAAAAVTGACSGNNKSTTGPTQNTQPPAPTRVIRLGGNLNFGDVIVGQVRSDGVLVINNDGNSTLTVTGITAPCGATAYSSSFTSGTITAGGSVTAAIRFAPVAVGSCAGTLTVNGDQTGGTNTIAITGNGVGQPPPAVRTMTGTWTGTWGPYNFTMVLTQTGTTVTGTYTDQDGPGRTDPGQPGTFNDPNVTLRVKQAAFADFTLRGVMDSSGRVVTGTATAAGGTSPLTMSKP
jgi:hypothetical protein